MTQLKNIDFWMQLLDRMPDSYKNWFEQEKKYLLKNIAKNSKVLEVGCGNGRIINDILSITANIVGIDHDNKAISNAKKNFKDCKNVKILRARAENLPFKNNEFDFVLCMATFANFADNKQKILSEMRRVLKDDGIIIVSVFSENAFDERMKMYKKLNAPIKEMKGTTVIFDEKIGDNISEQFSLAQLKGIFKNAKLGIVEIKKLPIAYICKLNKYN